MQYALDYEYQWYRGHVYTWLMNITHTHTHTLYKTSHNSTPHTTSLVCLHVSSLFLIPRSLFIVHRASFIVPTALAARRPPAPVKQSTGRRGGLLLNAPPLV